MKYLISGCAGFIGFHLCMKLLKNKKNKIIGIDNLNEYYDIDLKKNRLKILKKNKINFKFFKIDLADYNKLNSIFSKTNINIVINLAAQAGVRYSINNPKVYVESNINGFFNILDISKNHNIKNFYYASTSSVYGDTKKFPNREIDTTDNPLSFYAATKKSNEVLAHAYSKIYNMKTTGLRFFTVYGPYGRPDMALFKFTKNILNNKIIKIYNNGEHTRDFTYIDDVINAIVLLISHKNKNLYEIYNIGSSKPIKLMKFINLIELNLNKKAKTRFVNLQKGDVEKTFSSIKKIKKLVSFKPQTTINEGIQKFIDWYKYYYNVK